MSRSFIRSIKNLKSTPIEVKIKSATSNDSFGPTTMELNELSILTLQSNEATHKILDILTKRLKENGSKNHRHILKSLTVIEYVLLTGNSVAFVKWFKDHKFLITTLKEFEMNQNEEIAAKIRNKSRVVLKLLTHPDVLQEKRTNFHIFRNKMYEPAVNSRSSLEITRNSTEGLRIVTENIPLQFQRGTKSFDLTRGQFDILADGSSPTSGGVRREMDRLLADISED